MISKDPIMPRRIRKVLRQFSWLEKYPYSATQIFQKLQEMDFDGGFTIVKDYVSKVRPRPVEPFLKLAFAPGECAQVEWGTYGTVPVGGTRRKLHFFVMVLCYSRMMYVEFAVSQRMEHFLAGFDISDFSMVNPAALHWLENISNIRLHGETGSQTTGHVCRRAGRSDACCHTAL